MPLDNARVRLIETDVDTTIFLRIMRQTSIISEEILCYHNFGGELPLVFFNLSRRKQLSVKLIFINNITQQIMLCSMETLLSLPQLLILQFTLALSVYAYSMRLHLRGFI